MSKQSEIRDAAVTALEGAGIGTILNAEPVIADAELPAISVTTAEVQRGDRTTSPNTEDRQPMLTLLCGANGISSAAALKAAEDLAEQAETVLKADVPFLAMLMDFWFEGAEQTVTNDSGTPTAVVAANFVTEVEL